MTLLRVAFQKKKFKTMLDRENIKKDAKALFYIQAVETYRGHPTKLSTRLCTRAKVTMIVSHMHTYGDNITDELVVAKILRSLPPKFDHVVAAIEESKDITTLSFDELMGSLQAHEARINKNVAREDEQAFQVHGSKKDPPKIEEEA
ncbi:hypothetical protein Tco_0928714 [Tanacetum coccineum]